MIKMVQTRNFYGSMKASEINCLDISAGFPLKMDHYIADQKPWFFTAKSPMGKQFRTLALQDSVSCHPLWRSCTVWMTAFTYIAGVVVDAAVREKGERLDLFFDMKSGRMKHEVEFEYSDTTSTHNTVFWDVLRCFVFFQCHSDRFIYNRSQLNHWLKCVAASFA